MSFLGNASFRSPSTFPNSFGSLIGFITNSLAPASIASCILAKLFSLVTSITLVDCRLDSDLISRNNSKPLFDPCANQKLQYQMDSPLAQLPSRGQWPPQHLPRRQLPTHFFLKYGNIHISCRFRIIYNQDFGSVYFRFVTINSLYFPHPGGLFL